MANDNNFLFNVCFSDECTFFLNGVVNRHNCRYWADDNPRVFHEVHTQNPQKLNVWAGIFGNSVLGQFNDIEKNFNAQVTEQLSSNYRT